MFRVSANDDIVDHFLAKHVVEKLKKGKPGVILENTPWGQSNEVGLTNRVTLGQPPDSSFVNHVHRFNSLQMFCQLQFTGRLRWPSLAVARSTQSLKSPGCAPAVPKK